MHNKPHTPEAKAKMSLAHKGKPTKWGHLPELEIVERLLHSDATTRSIAAEYGCSDSTIKLIFKKHTTLDQRIKVKISKQAKNNKGNPGFGQLAKSLNIWQGRTHTDSSRNKQSLAKKGKLHSLKQRIRKSAVRQGISVDEWKGFVSSPNRLARATLEYKNWREAVYARDDYTCQMCGKRGGRLHPHHIKTFAKYPELRFDVNNGVTLCAEPCHKKTIGHEEEYEHLFFRQSLGMGCRV